MKRTLSLTLAALALAASPAAAVVLFDSGGFESPGYNLGNLAGQNTWLLQGTATATVQNTVSQSGSQAVSLSGTANAWAWPNTVYTPAPGEIVSVRCAIRRGSDANTVKHFGYLVDVYNGAGSARVARFGIADNGGALVAMATTLDGVDLVNLIIAENLQWDQWYDFTADLDFANQVYDVRVNGQLAASGLPFVATASNFGDADFQLAAVTGATDVGYYDNYLVEVIQEPRIRTQPQDRLVAVGDAALFSVLATGAQPLSYQWLRGGAPISGATLSAYTLNNCQLADSGSQFSCVVTNPFGAVTSSLASLTVIVGVPLCEAVDACTLPWTSGGNASWMGQTTVSYDGVDAAESGLITHSQQSWVETTVTGPGVVTFWWSVSSEFGFDFLDLLTNGVIAAEITGEVPWTELSVRVAAGPQTLRWRYSKDSTDEDPVGMDRGWLDQVTYVADGPEPIIIANPTDQTVTEGDSAIFTVVASGAPPLSYQWLSNGVPISGATLATYIHVNSQVADLGSSFQCMVTNSYGATNSSPAFLIVLPGISLCQGVDACNLTWLTGGTLPWFGQADTTHDGVDAGQNGDISDSQESWVETTVEGPGTLTFWWNVSSESGFDFLEFRTNGILSTRISGTSGTWAQITQRVEAGSQALRWRYFKDSSVSTGLDSAWLDQVVYVADDPAPVVLTQPQSQSVSVGGSAVFAFGVSGRLPITYTWTRNGATIVGATSSNYTLTNCQPSDSGSVFRCAATNAWGWLVSDPATLTVVAPETLTFQAPGAITIPSIGAGSPYPSIIAVAGLVGPVLKVTASLNQLNHTYPDDLDILLVSPDGQKVMLMSDAGGGTDLVNVNLTFDQSASSTLPDSTVIVSGTYRPTDFATGETMPAPAPAGPYVANLDVFIGGNPNGDWKLYVADDATGDTGNIAGGWTLRLTVPASPQPVFLPPYLAGGAINLGFQTTAGVTYVIEWSETMIPGSWQTLATVVGTGSLYTTTDPVAGHPYRFYRIRKP